MGLLTGYISESTRHQVDHGQLLLTSTQLLLTSTRATRSVSAGSGWCIAPQPPLASAGNIAPVP